MQTRKEAAAEAAKAKNLVERMSKAMDEMAAYTEAAEAKLKVMEAWVCKILRNTNEFMGRESDAEIQIKRQDITEALQRYKLKADFSGDNLILSVMEVEHENTKNSDTAEPGNEEKPQPDYPCGEGAQAYPVEGVPPVRKGCRVVH